MKVNVDGKAGDYRTVWMENGIVRLINQQSLPYKFEISDCKNVDETARAIKDMVVRGAPAIGATACYGMAQSVLHKVGIEKGSGILSASRPTAYDLFDAIEYFKKNYSYSKNVDAVKIADSYANESVERCKKIGFYGNSVITNNMRILTHCNAGALATVDYGTALAPIRSAHYSKKKIFVYVDETRPRLQGSMLTAWELSQEGIDHAIIVDNAAGYYMQKGLVDLVIVGADRIARNGDIANKIGTYEKAVVAKENNIPFYVAAPKSTIDLDCKSAKSIPIEERSKEEITHFRGIDAKGNLQSVRIPNETSSVSNPAFDTTPAKYVTGIITEKGIIRANESEILSIFNK